METVVLSKASAAVIAEIEKECFAHPWSEQSIISSINAGHVFFGVIFGDTLCGYIGVNRVAGQAYIDNIAVRREYRRQGIAKALIKAVIDECKNDDFITLEVRASNKAAISLYRLFGFKDQGKRRGFYTAPTEDALIMTLYNREEK